MTTLINFFDLHSLDNPNEFKIKLEMIKGIPYVLIEYIEQIPHNPILPKTPTQTQTLTPTEKINKLIDEDSNAVSGTIRKVNLNHSQCKIYYSILFFNWDNAQQFVKQLHP